MNIVYFLLINIYIQLTSCNENSTCNFNEPKRIVKLVQKISSPLKSLSNKLAKQHDIAADLDIDLSDEGIDINVYFYEAFAFEIIFVVLFLIFLLYFLIFCLCNICHCCRSKNSKKPSIALTLFHFIGIIILLLTGVLLIFSSRIFIKVIENIKSFPADINGEIDSIFGQVNATCYNTFNLIEKKVENFTLYLTNFSDWMSASNTDNINKANEASQLTVSYNDTFGNESGDYMTNYTSILQLATDKPVEDELLTKIENLNKTRQPSITAIIETIDSFLDSSQTIASTVESIKETNKNSIDSIKVKINGFKANNLNEEMTKVQESISDSRLDLQQIEDLSDTFSPYVKIVPYVIAGLTLFVAVIFAAIFCCRNCFSRCCACSFPLFGFILCLVIVLPGAIFAILFVLLTDLCPDLESAIHGLAFEKDKKENVYLKKFNFFNYADQNSHNSIQIRSTGNSIKNLTDLLLCPSNTPLLDLLEIGFDPDSIIDDFGATASDGFSVFEIDELKSKFDTFADGFDADRNIQASYILRDYKPTLSEVQQELGESASRQVASMETLIAGKDDEIQKVRDLMKSVIGFGTTIVPEVAVVQNETLYVVDRLIGEAKSGINDELDLITCRPFRCAYSPFKNLVCVDFLTGVAIWIVAMIISMLGVFILSITVCLRRKSMKSPKVKNNESSSDKSIEEFEDKKKKKKSKSDDE